MYAGGAAVILLAVAYYKKWPPLMKFIHGPLGQGKKPPAGHPGGHPGHPGMMPMMHPGQPGMMPQVMPSAMPAGAAAGGSTLPQISIQTNPAPATMYGNTLGLPPNYGQYGFGAQYPYSLQTPGLPFPLQPIPGMLPPMMPPISPIGQPYPSPMMGGII